MTTKEQLVFNKMKSLIDWLDSQCPEVTPPLDSYETSDLSYDFAEILRYKLSELTQLKAEVDWADPLWKKDQDVNEMVKEQSHLSADDLINRMRENKGDWTRHGIRLYYAEDAIIKAMTERQIKEENTGRPCLHFSTYTDSDNFTRCQDCEEIVD